MKLFEFDIAHTGKRISLIPDRVTRIEMDCDKKHVYVCLVGMIPNDTFIAIHEERLDDLREQYLRLKREWEEALNG